jgi:cytochrome c6
MKKIISVLLLGITIFTFAFSSPALAADAAAGKGIFTANCAQCHAGGKNLVNAAKTLKKEDLEKYGMYSAEAIIAQVTNGKAAMPAFKGRLKPDQIENVAAYVLEQADAGWK